MSSPLSTASLSVVIPIQTISFYNQPQPHAIPPPIGCHTYPNDKLLQPTIRSVAPSHVLCCHTYPNDKLLQREVSTDGGETWCCHTYPNDKLLQPVTREWLVLGWYVVIPIQTISFYNLRVPTSTSRSSSCHTYPNDKLLQRGNDPFWIIVFGCHTYPNDKLLQPSTHAGCRSRSELSYLSKR